MKPTKNRVFCKDCGRSKMLFETEKKAATFIKFNGDDIEKESGVKPERSYFCTYCGGWHVTSKKEFLNIKSRTEIVLDIYNEEKRKKAEQKEIRALLVEEKKKELELILSNLEKQISILNKTHQSEKGYPEILEVAVDLFNQIQKYKGVSFNGSNKRIKLAKEKIKTYDK
jgi:hypothetical protein